MKQGVLLIMGTAEAPGTYARSEIRTLFQRSMFTNVSIVHQIRSPWAPASEPATVQHPPRRIPARETLSALRHNGPTFPPFPGRGGPPAPHPVLPLSSWPHEPVGVPELSILPTTALHARVCPPCPSACVGAPAVTNQLARQGFISTIP